jgi:cell division protein FtsQ
VSQNALPGDSPHDEPVGMHLFGALDRLSRKSPAAARAPRWHGTSAGLWPRSLRRAIIRLTEMKVPRGMGSTATALLLLASISYGAVRGGHGPDIAANLQDLCDDLANGFGFRISEVALTGQRELARDRVLAIAGVTGHSSLLFLDPANTRARLVSNPWIAEATVLKLYPGRLRIDVKERKPFALWQKDGNVYLIAEDGTVLESFVPQRFASLPLVVGKGAEHAAPELLKLVAHYPLIAKKVQASVRVAERRWDLYLKDKVIVSLPEIAPEQALAHLVALDGEKHLLSRDIVLVDLRLSDRIIVRQSDAAAAARESALKAAEKAKKKKGGEA